MSEKLRGLFINTKKEICSIYESGKMCFDCLVNSDQYSLSYIEVDADNREIGLDYDFFVFNYHWVKMGWLDTKLIRNLPGIKFTIVLEMSQNSPFDCVSNDDFDGYLVLDPTCKHFQSNVYSFSRPLEVVKKNCQSSSEEKIPTIGTFGLSFSDKGFDEVVKAVNDEFEEAVIRINVPLSENVSPEMIEQFRAAIRNLHIKDTITVELTNHYFEKDELINWCARNTLNVFLYNRRIGNGLSATTDQAIASGRPLAVSTNPTFRHIHTYIAPYPYLKLKESIQLSIPLVKKIQDDWSPENFRLKFESILNGMQLQSFSKSNQKILLYKKDKAKNLGLRIFSKAGIREFIPPILFKIRDKSKLFFSKRAISGSTQVNAQSEPLRPFVHQVLHSNSQFQEDLILDLLFSGKRNGCYVDIGANDPFFNSNTLRFYTMKGWRGINIEPGVSAYKKFVEYRGEDINLNMAISDTSGNLTFYHIGNDSTLSTLNYDAALKMAETYNLRITTSAVEVATISKVFDSYLNNRKIDYMSVDAEGHDLAVLKSNNWEMYRPTIVMVESNIDSREIIMFMDKQKYLYIYSNHVNAIFVDKMTTDQDVLKNISWGN